MEESILPLLFVTTIGLLWMLYRLKIKRLINYRCVEVNRTLFDDDSAMINALVTGGSGMLGREIVSCLLKDGGYKVHSLDLFIPDLEYRNSGVCSYIQADVTNYDDFCKATRGMDVIFHTAAILPTVMGATNADFDRVIVQGTANVITACKECKVKRLVYTSTADVVISKGVMGVDNTDEEHLFPKEPLNAYVSTKGRSETAVLAANGRDGLTTGALRPGGILELVLYPKLKHLVYIGDRERMLPLVACGDLAKAHLQLDKILTNTEHSSAAGRAFNLSSSVPEKELDDLVATEKGNGQNLIARRLPMSIFILLTYFNVICHWVTGIAPVNSVMTLMALDILKLKFHTYSSARAQAELGWRPTPWKSIVKRLIKEWKETKKET
jgi:sterol-4alpha-carboxylate 3-dehydrogenase (decarboxylating)